MKMMIEFTATNETIIASNVTAPATNSTPPETNGISLETNGTSLATNETFTAHIEAVSKQRTKKRSNNQTVSAVQQYRLTVNETDMLFLEQRQFF